MISAVLLLITFFFFFLKLIIFIACSPKDSLNFFMQSLPLYTLYLFSMLLNDYIVHIEKSDRISSLFQEEISSCTAVHMHYVLDACNHVWSRILLLHMVGGTSSMLVLLTRLTVSEPEHWVTWSLWTDINFPFLSGKESNI